MAQQVGIVTTECLPPLPHPCSGGGVRVWGVGEALRRQGINCTYFLREGTPGTDPLPDQVPVQLYKPEWLSDQLEQSRCDAVLFEQWQPMTFLQSDIDIPILVDLPGPLILEYFWRDRVSLQQHIADKIHALSKADYFICAHERQRGYYTAWLTWAGLSPDADRLAVVPFVFHEMPVSRQGHVEDEPLFFWGGMFWPWQERQHAFRSIVETLQHDRRGQLVVVGFSEQDVETVGFDSSYTQHPHVSWLGALEFYEYVIELKRAAVAVDLCKPTEERRLSSDLRTGTALWAGTPCLVTPQSPWASWIEEYNAGWVLEYDDHKQLQHLVKEIALERVDIVARRRGAQSISERISRDENVSPLASWLENPVKRTPCPTFFEARWKDREQRIKTMQREIDRLRFENDQLQHDLASIRSHPLFKLYKKMAFWK